MNKIKIEDGLYLVKTSRGEWAIVAEEITVEGKRFEVRGSIERRMFNGLHGDPTSYYVVSSGYIEDDKKLLIKEVSNE